MNSAGIRAAVFDLGGVLVDVPGAAAMRQLAGIATDEETWVRWLQCAWVSRFERGECSAADFAAGVVADWNLPLAPPAFLEAFRSWENTPSAGAVELVADVSERVPVIALSNMNHLHWESMAEWDLLSGFSDVFLSYRLGLAKPDRAVFELVAGRLGVRPAELLFLDDNQLNVDAAIACGYRARRVRGVAEARLALVEEEILTP